MSSENTFLEVKNYWKTFIDKLETKIYNLKNQIENIDKELNRIRIITNIIKNSENNIELILSEKNTILEIDNNLTREISILEALAKRGNLDNDLATVQYQQIINSSQILKFINSNDELIQQKENINNEINRCLSIINNNCTDFKLLNALIDELLFNKQEKNMILFWPIYEKSSQNKKIEEEKEEKQEIPEVRIEVETLEMPELLEETKNDNKNIEAEYRKTFEELQLIFNKLKSDNRELLDKFYGYIQNMSIGSIEIIKKYIYASDEEIQNIYPLISEDVDYCDSIVTFLKLQTHKSDIEDLFKETDNMFLNFEGNKMALSQNLEIIKDEGIKEFQTLLDKLNELDIKLTEKEIIAVDESHIFFATNISGVDFIPEDLKANNYKDFITFSDKFESNGHLINKGLSVNKMKGIKSPGLEKTVFLKTGKGIQISFVNLNNGILILTASSTSETITEETNRVIGINREHLLDEILAIETLEPEEMLLQESIRNSILGQGRKS